MTWSQVRPGGGGGLFALVQVAYPLIIGLVAAAVTSLLLRRVFRAHRQAMVAELDRLHAELQAQTRGMEALTRELEGIRVDGSG